MGYMCLGFDTTSPRHAYLKAKKLVLRRLGNNFQRGDMNEYTWWPCFANVYVDFESKPSAYGMAFNISYDYPTEYIDSPDFLKRVRKWILVGKSLGLQFQGLKFQLLKCEPMDYYKVKIPCSYCTPEEPVASRVLIFYLPLENINTRKMLHLHLFFLRYLYEKHGTVDRYFELRSLFKRKYPWVSRYGTLQLAEQSCHLAKATGTKWFKQVAHHFLIAKSLECVITTGAKLGHSNLFTMAEGVTNFDTELAGPMKRIINWSHTTYHFELDNKSEFKSHEEFMSVMAKLDKIYKERLKENE